VGTGWDSLTPSEQEVAQLIASGMTNSQVATWLGMSPHTVDGRLRRASYGFKSDHSFVSPPLQRRIETSVTVV
jgi:DNA-binding CsgD family transcriptional regulator